MRTQERPARASMKRWLPSLRSHSCSSISNLGRHLRRTQPLRFYRYLSLYLTLSLFVLPFATDRGKQIAKSGNDRMAGINYCIKQTGEELVKMQEDGVSTVSQLCPVLSSSYHTLDIPQSYPRGRSQWFTFALPPAVSDPADAE